MSSNMTAMYQLMSLTDEELRNINSNVCAILTSRRIARSITAASKGTFKVGDRVSFDAGRGRGIVTGVVSSVKRVKCLVKPDYGYQTWNVPMGSMKKV